MALTPEDGSGLAAADTYFTLAEARAYAADYGYTLPVDNTAAEVALRKAAQFVDTNQFKGTKLVATQGLDFPREGAYCEGVEVEIATQLLKAGRAQVVYADAVTSGVIVRGNDNGKEVQSNEVSGAVKQSFFQSHNTSDTVTITAAVDQLDCLIDPFSNSFTFRTVRA